MGSRVGFPTRVLKLGGSVITCRTVPHCPDLKVIRRIVREIIPFKEGLVIVHGGGSFGHFEASMGISKRRPLIAAAMQELNSLLLRELYPSGIHGFPVPGRYYSEDNLLRILGEGMTPVIYGDINERGEIISGDDLTLKVAKSFSLIALFSTDVDGVLLHGRPVPELRSFEDVEFGITHGYNVTGGMAEKLRKIFSFGVDAMIFNGKREGNVFNALKGERVGTFIKVKK
ncbi:MAG: uridylate kinase [Metallosphaera yellowstonensis]|jgi:Predicted archaeal kinase